MVVAMKKEKPTKKDGGKSFGAVLERHGITPEVAAKIMGLKEGTVKNYCDPDHRLSITNAGFGRVMKLVTQTPIKISEIWKPSDPQTTMEDDDLDGLESAASRVENRIANLFRRLDEIQDGQREIRAQQQKTQERVTSLQAEQQKTQEHVKSLSERVARLEDDGPSLQGRKRRA